KVAAEAELAILPGVIRGTRSMLRSDQWFPRRAAISVEIGEPVMPSGADFTSVLRLRDAVRNAMLARCGEPDLGELIKPASSQTTTGANDGRRCGTNREPCDIDSYQSAEVEVGASI